ncbi:sulfite exporter TauE/SafE family protein [Maliponia aquimaris]|uniref:Probable membrane transporter protein n=1 Tax=Maliponia aquimaris TaxID=1673631 RepID=A0A238L211_9RHOB|nr:sulfite exporter TauE/SafE family protein [Maliponia aquimaris]SMX48900.1 hypothetical protein MAA8898_04162 [Maliponia aquimaris]
MLDILLLLLAAFAAGVVNTIAGGGTFLTFPALVFTGMPPVLANATSAVAVFPGYLGGALGFRDEIARLDRRALIRMTVTALSGGLAGAGLLLVSSDAAFAAVVPFLLIGATAVFVWGDRLRAWLARSSRGIAAYGAPGLFLVALYGGYFNGGLGIVLLALFTLWGMADIHQMNGLKNALSFAVSAISVTVFAVAGLVAWPQAVAMMVAATVGGYAGAPLSRILPRTAVRGAIAVAGFGTGAVFLWRLVV